jgi:Ser/Thr protein kinase RdoA (MazF antagonist)
VERDEFFYRLTPDAVMRSIEELGLIPGGHWLQLNSMENRVFSLPLEDGSQIVVKYYRPGRWTREQILEEHAFLFELQEEEIPVCAPLRFGGESLFVAEGIFYTVWNKTGGRSVDEYDAGHMELLGRLMGRLHRIGERRPALSRRTFNAETMIRQPLDLLHKGKFLPQQFESRFTDSALEIAALYEEQVAGVPLLRIHGDCHPGNILFDRDNFFFLDFDDFVAGPAVQDFWMLFQDTGERGRRLRDAFLSGYAVFRDYDPRWLRLTEILRAMRFIHSAAWIARRWKDPAFPAHFPHFGTDAYWEQETNDLENQLADIHEALGNGPQQSGPEPLSNKDFFWDME